MYAVDPPPPSRMSCASIQHLPAFRLISFSRMTIWGLLLTLMLTLTAGSARWGDRDSVEPSSACGSRPVAAPAGAKRRRQIPVYWRVFQDLVPDGRGGHRFLSPEEVVELGGDIVAGGSYTGVPIDVPRTKKLRDNMTAARRLAVERGTDLCQLIMTRPDHYVEIEGAETVPGFSDDWIFRTPVAGYRQDVERFESRGWTAQPLPYVSRKFMTRVSKNGEMKPNFYGSISRTERRYGVNGVLVDLRDPEYRRWQLDWLESLVEFVGADGVAFGIKTGWHANPMHYPKASPTGRYGGPLSDTPYGEGEYERAVEAWILEARERGLRVAVRDSTPGAGGPGAWFSPELEAAIEGHYVPILLPGNSTIRDLIRRSLE
jgi:hypothetical protein